MTCHSFKCVLTVLWFNGYCQRAMIPCSSCPLDTAAYTCTVSSRENYSAACRGDPGDMDFEGKMPLPFCILILPLGPCVIHKGIFWK